MICKRFIAFYCCLFLVLACARKPIQSGTSSVFTPMDTAGRIRVLTYNIHHANPPSRSGFIDIVAIANVIKQQQPDIVALQEVDVNTDWSGKNLHQANELALLTGMQAYFCKSIDYGGGEYGNAVLSKLPMEGPKSVQLPTDDSTKGEPRTLGTAIITLPKGDKIVFAFTHLDAQGNSTNRLLQIRKIIALLQAEKLPVIVTGDFNAVPGSDVINIVDNNFTRTCISRCGFTIAANYPYQWFGSFYSFETQW